MTACLIALKLSLRLYEGLLNSALGEVSKCTLEEELAECAECFGQLLKLFLC